MQTLTAALSLRRLLGDNATLRLLRADNAAVIVALLGNHLADPGARIAAEELHDLIDADLDDLREPFGLGEKNGKAYCDDWRAMGILIRRPAAQVRAETYELSAPGYDALRILDQVDRPTTTLTESRLRSLAMTLHSLAVDTDPDASRKLAALIAQRDSLDEQIKRLQSGESHVMEERAAREGFFDILAQAQALPADFARVRAEFEALNHELRVSVLNADSERSRLVDDIFRGVDLIASSDAGQTFSAFASLLRDPEQSSAFEHDIGQVLDRDFALRLPLESRAALRRLISDLKDGSRSVNQSLTDFARGLRRYVQSQEFQRDRVLKTKIQAALASALASSTTAKPYDDIGLELELSSLPIRSIGALAVHDPSDFDAGEALRDATLGTADLAALAAASLKTEIDFAQLVRDINKLLETSASVSISATLQTNGAMQGAATVVGLISLATRYGQEARDMTEEITWDGDDGVTRVATIPHFRFTERIEY